MRAGERGVAMVTALAEEWQGVATRRRGVNPGGLSSDVMFKLHSVAVFPGVVVSFRSHSDMISLTQGFEKCNS